MEHKAVSGKPKFLIPAGKTSTQIQPLKGHTERGEEAKTPKWLAALEKFVCDLN